MTLQGMDVCVIGRLLCALHLNVSHNLVSSGHHCSPGRLSGRVEGSRTLLTLPARWPISALTPDLLMVAKGVSEAVASSVSTRTE